ncbi:MAG: TonB-dependent receptor [Alistipes sp.]|uniref:SusC/RagA family TonB-linked outer membrane protein n=1 Tax=Alistipes sp. TaxID=1872444 RepID=UPI0025BB9BB8|nr:TonB-dependent receptor [Alistipes sp.]MCD8276231.1 TonB-dependent receptor [Alistipes sp.]
MVKGTQTGVSSDVEGNYEIVVPGPGSVLVFNYLGYQPQEIAVGNRTQIDVRLAEDNNVLDDVVVIGYGTQSRRTLTSAVSKVSGADLEGVPVNSIGDALKGKVPGVRVSTANNQPGSDPVFLIRGGSSINQSNAPIIIVDGVRREMTGLNTNDIESIEILKDAASAGIYGASASNGVILVTTKKGNRAKGPQITFEAQAAWTSPATKFDLMDARDYVVTMRRVLNDCPGYTYGQVVLTGANSAGIGNGDSSIWTTRYLQEGESVPRGWSSVVDPVDPSKIIVFQDNDQQSQWFDDSYWMQYYVGVNGGSDKVTYAASASYMKDGGIGINTDFSRFTFHGNTSFKITKSLTAGTTFDYSETSGNEIPSSGIGDYWTTLGRGMFMPATHRDYLEDGEPAQGTNSTTISAAWFDRYYTNNYVTRRSTANFNLKWDIIDGLSAFAQIANHNSYKNSYQYLAGNAISQNRQTYEGWSQTNRLSFQAHVDYNKSFGDHNLSAMVGYDFLKRKINGMSMTVQGAESDKTPTLGAGTTPTAWTDTQTPWCQISYFGRLNYNYKEKYILGFTMRADGSSLFAKDNRWGYFPAVSAGWVVSEEKFWNIEKFNQLKLRLSYGLTGNNNVDYYDTLGAYSVTGIYAGSGATLASTLPNLGLTWEKTKQFDIGLDMAFFNNRLRVAADYYSKKSEELLFDVSLPDTSGYGSAMQNVGSIRFYGLEFEISSVNVSTKNFSWTTDFTYSFNANKVLSLPDEYYYKDIDGKDAWRIGGYTMSESGYRFGGTAVGEPLGRIYGYKTSYIIESEAQADAALYDSSSHGYRRSDGLSIAGRKDVGDYEWKNRAGSALTADGREQINDEDMFLLGNVVPHSTGGMNNTFKFKNLTLSVYLDYALGHSIYNYQYTRCFQTSMGNCNWNLIYDALNTWQKPGDDTKFARLTPNDADGGNRNYSRISNINVQKADYLCLRDVTLSYDLPLRWIRKVGLGRLTVSVSGNTLCYWTGVKGISPESASVGSSTGMYSVTSSSSTSFNNYPPTRKVLFGLKATF